MYSVRCMLARVPRYMSDLDAGHTRGLLHVALEEGLSRGVLEVAGIMGLEVQLHSLGNVNTKQFCTLLLLRTLVSIS
mgnify:CR=1 FL=1